MDIKSIFNNKIFENTNIKYGAFDLFKIKFGEK